MSIGLAGLLCLGGGSILSGCSVELSPDKEEKVFSVIDKADLFMDQYSALVENQNSQVEKQVAFEKYSFAVSKLQTNYQNIWNNMTIRIDDIYETNNISSSGSEGSLMSFYKTQDGKQLFIIQYGSNSGSRVDFLDTDGVAKYISYDEGGNIWDKGTSEILTLSYQRNISMMTSPLIDLSGENVVELNKDNIYKIEKNGDNEVITFAYNYTKELNNYSGDYKGIFVVELNEDGDIISTKSNLFLIELKKDDIILDEFNDEVLEDLGYFPEQVRSEFTFAHGTVSQELVQKTLTDINETSFE